MQISADAFISSEWEIEQQDSGSLFPPEVKLHWSQEMWC